MSYPAANITGISSAFIYGNTVTNGMFVPITLICFFVVLSGIMYTLTKERTFAVSTFCTLIISALFSAAGLLDPIFLFLNLIAFAASVYFLSRVAY